MLQVTVVDELDYTPDAAFQNDIFVTMFFSLSFQKETMHFLIISYPLST